MNLEPAIYPAAETVGVRRRNPDSGIWALNARLSPFTLLYGAILYSLLTALTAAIFQADTPDYENSILTYSGGADLHFWDFGHLIWRPVLWLLLHESHVLASGLNQPILLFRIMLAINWAAGLGCIFLLARLLGKFVNARLAILMSAVLAITQVFLNYVHTGTPYVPGLFFIILTLEIAAARALDSDRGSLWTASFCGVTLALAVLLWLPYVFVLPAVLLFPIMLGGRNRETVFFTLTATAFCAFVGLGVYGSVALKLHLLSLPQIRDWIELSSHSINHIGGLPRAVYGFNAAWFEMGSDGIQFRQYLLHDPYAHVSGVALLSTGLWKLVATYVVFLAVVLKLLRGSVRDHRVLGFLALTFLPVFAFGIKWQGGDMERYLPAFPAILLSAACAFEVRPRLLMKISGFAFVSALLAVNLTADARWVQDSKTRLLSARADALVKLPEQSYVFIMPGDPLKLFVREAFVTGQSRPYRLGYVLDIGHKDASEWQGVFASTSLDTWRKGGEVWICGCLQDAAPQRKWHWVEGAEPQVGWNDIYLFFRHLQVSEARGDFVKIPPIEANIEFLKTVPPPGNGYH